jgi:hypothetical protein
MRRISSGENAGVAWHPESPDELGLELCWSMDHEAWVGGRNARKVEKLERELMVAQRKVAKTERAAERLAARLSAAESAQSARFGRALRWLGQRVSVNAAKRPSREQP